MSSTDAARLLRTAEGHLRAGRVADGIEVYRALLAVDPAQPDAWYNLAWLERQDRQFGAALASYGEAIGCGMAAPEAAHVNRAAILSEHLDRADDAVTELGKALAANPEFVPALLNLGNLAEDRGDPDDARAAYARALAIAPENGRAIARLTVLDIAQGSLDGARTRLDAARPLSPEDRIETGFANAMLFDAAGDYSRAFPALLAANAAALALAGPAARYDHAAQERFTDALTAAFPVASPSPQPTPGPKPVFICGMFRSGSTLCETVVARHPKVTMGGELEFVSALVAALPGYPVAAGDFGAMRETYLSGLVSRFPGASIVTDKRPDNFLHIGLIKAMFPNAKIVHTVREPRDTALSILFLWFQDSVRYGARLEDIAHYMRCYRRLMTHWQRIYGQDIVTFDYDRFVTAPEEEARALFAALGLDWSADCAPRPALGATVRTPSAWAVRQPVHTRSSGRWRHYETALAPFLAALER